MSELLINYYRCNNGHREFLWVDTWDCAVDEECPECGVDISPYKSEEPNY